MTVPRGPARPAESFLLGTDGPEVRIPPRIARVLDTRGGLGRLRREVRGLDAQLDAVLLAVHLAGLAWLEATEGSAVRKLAEAPASSPWVDTRGATDLLGVTPSRVRQLLRAKVLPAEHRGGRWVLARTDVSDYRAARAA